MFAIMNMKKVKIGDVSKVAKEQGRTIDDYRNGAKYANDIDWTRTEENIVLVPTDGAKSRLNALIKEARARTRPDSVGAIGVVISASSDFFSQKKDERGWEYDSKTADYFEDAKKWIVDNLCGGDERRLLSCVVHMDETCPHLQALVAPLVENERGQTVLSAKRIMNGRQKMRELQNSFFEQVGKKRGLERGELVDLDKPPQKKRKEPQEWREEQLREAQAKVIEAAEFLQEGSPSLLENVKDAAFGRGKIIPNEDFEQIVKILKNAEALANALEGLKQLAKQADKDGRVLTAEGFLQAAEQNLAIGRDKMAKLKPEVLSSRELVEALERVPVRQGLSMRDVWEQTVRFNTSLDGSIDYDRLAQAFINNIKFERSRNYTRPQQELEYNDRDSFEFHHSR